MLVLRECDVNNFVTSCSNALCLHFSLTPCRLWSSAPRIVLSSLLFCDVAIILRTHLLVIAPAIHSFFVTDLIANRCCCKDLSDHWHSRVLRSQRELFSQFWQCPSDRVVTHIFNTLSGDFDIKEVLNSTYFFCWSARELKVPIKWSWRMKWFPRSWKVVLNSST